ncbi:TonB-dependent receptor domain-containing protein [Stenotrophomonas bentonitica]|uniref:TonB-dependent receptor n=1 Tax=Stenotrophomonas bentonitica TaxID=1450134 RepID=UPI0037D87B94
MIKQAMPLRRATLTIALGLCLAGAAHAQSVTGNIYGSGEPGSTISVQNLDTGTSRTVTVDRNGRYRASDLPNGNYKVTVEKDGQVIAVRERVQVVIASGTEVSFSGTGVQQLDRIEVRATAVPKIDVSQTDTRTVFTSEQLKEIAVGRDIASVALLAPSVISNASYTSGGVTVPSFGGAASSENAFYINGFAVTNPLSSIGFTTLPFDAISQQQVLTGGYGAEFGRATGGVVNIVTKRGTNEWSGGGYAYWSPETLRASPRNSNFADTGFYGADNPDPTKRTDGQLYQLRNKNQSWTQTTGAYVGGPIVKDKLFIYANVEVTKREGAGVASTSQAAATTTNAWQEYSYEYPRWAAKIDWNITDNHLLEFTGISDVTKYDSAGYTFNYADFTHGNEQNAGTSNEDKSKLYIGKYTGYLTDDLTVSALYGTQKIDHSQNPWGYDPACPRTSAVATARAPGIPAANYAGCWTAATVNVPGAYDETKGWRLDVGYRLGNHDLRAGLDVMEAESYTGSEYGGGFIWVYSRSNNPNAAIDASHGVGSPASAGGLGSQGYYVRQQYYTQIAKVRTEQSAQFLEDRWQVSDNVLLTLGLRNETFKNFTSADEVYVKQDNQWAPRLGGVWDVHGDASLKLFANAGRYHLALPNNVAVRAASGSLYTMEYFTYTGVAADGTPTGLVNVPVDPSLGYTCPGNPNAISSNLECGDAPDPRTVAAVDLKSHYQDEFIVGMEQAWGENAVWGAKVTYRDLKSAIDDTCTPALGGGCFIFNPGVGNTFWEEQADGTLAKHTYSAAELDLPKLKRRYYAVDLFLEGSIGERFYGKVNYTFARNYGNTEGQLASDLDTGAGGQTDVSVTQDWDLPQLMVGANGPLPNHRAHQIKAYGSYRITPEWRVGGSLLIDSGRPRSCTSYYPTADQGLYNGAYYHFCGLAGSGTAPGSAGYIPPSADYRFSPRGDNGTTPWGFNLNLSLAYTPNWADNKLSLQADVLNVLNRQVAGSYYSNYATDRVTPDPRYNQPLNYNSPRQVRLSARYDF